jgi:hypothetical protein
MACANNLKQIALAMHAYHDAYGQFPPAYIADESGRPSHSWRALILPFLESSGLERQYSFDEPWDGPNNRQLADKIPDVFRCPSYKHHRGHHGGATEGEDVLTQYVALVGPKTIFPGREPVSFEDVQDGASNTLLVVEVHGDSVHWMKPEDIDPESFAQWLDQSHDENTNHSFGTQVALADASVRFISATIDGEVLHRLITIAAGEDVGAY